MVGPPFLRRVSCKLGRKTLQAGNPAIRASGVVDMRSNTGSFNRPQTGQISSLWVLGARVTWTVLGPFALLLITAGIVSRGTGWATALDVCFGVVVGLMLFGRWVEQRSGSATSLHGEPSTLEQCKRYMIGLLLVAVALWSGANLLGNHILR